MPMVEVVVSVRLDPFSKLGDHGISNDSETLYDEISYFPGDCVEDALCGADNELTQAIDAVVKRMSADDALVPWPSRDERREVPGQTNLLTDEIAS